MVIRFQCPQCGKTLSVKSEYAGREGKCPCGAVVAVPAEAEKIAFRCGSCGKIIRVPQIHAGKKGRCPQCRNIVVVPGAGGRSAVDGLSGSAERPLPLPAGMVIFRCPMCDEDIEAQESSRGNLVECPKCGSFAQAPEKKAAGKEGATEGRGRRAGAVLAGGAAADEPGGRAAPSTGKVICPSCERKLADDAKVCVGCGIYVGSGRPILTARGADEDLLYERSRKVVSPISWLIPLGIYPVYSEAMGRHRPYATWAITAVTIAVSIWFLAYQLSGSTRMRSMKNLMLWGGQAEPEAGRIQWLYEYTNYGDREAFLAKREKLSVTTPESELDRAALKELSSEEQCFGQYRHSQLITHAFLHGGILHLAGNMLFLLIFGSRVNSAIGNILTPVLYVVLAIAAALTQLVMSSGQPPGAMLGASGAVMGMAGVYLLLFPIHRIYLTAWLRWGLIAGFHLSFKFFAWRGFWVVLFYIFFDVVAVSLAVKTGTAHWAHIGGLFWGIAAGLVLLVSRAAYSGSDVLSLIFGRYAWGLIGSPHSHQKDTT